MPRKFAGLGRGLDALIAPSAAERDSESDKKGIIEIDINKIEPNRSQPRKHFDEESLAELAESLKEFGVIQPIIVKEEDGYFSIIAGERRWRAARIAKLTKIPALIKDYSEREMLQIALIENIQRQDLNPIEEATCYRRLTDEFFFTQEELASKVGKSRNLISYSMSLLNLDPDVQDYIIDGSLTAGHGRVLLPVRDVELQLRYAEKAVENGLSVRETERLIRLGEAERHKSEKPEHAGQKNYTRLESDLRSILGTGVRIKDGKNKGKIEIEYYSPGELDRLLGMLKNLSDIM